MIEEIADGRTDLVFEYLAGGHAANSTDRGDVSLIQWCAYYGDVSAIKFLLANGESLDSLGEDFGLPGACFHGHWRLCKFLIERGGGCELSAARYGRNAAAFGTVHSQPAGKRFSREGSPRPSRESELCNQAGR